MNLAVFFKSLFVLGFLAAWEASTPERVGAEGLIERAALTDGITRKRSFRADPSQEGAAAVVHVIRQDLPVFIRQVALRNGFDAVVSEKIDGVIHNRRYPVGLVKIMPELASQFSLLWFLQGDTLFVSSSAELAEREIPLSAGENLASLKSRIKQSGIKHGNQLLLPRSERNAVLVKGTAQFIEQIVELTDAQGVSDADD